jgi:GDP-4-dehydro-6-deoxy-D-mannose reductase
LKILVTGAPGFVGRHLTAELLRAGHEVVLTGVTKEAVSIYEYGSLPVLKMDITDPAECLRVLGQCAPEAVIHLAGIAKTTEQNSSLLDSVNIHGPENVVRAFSSVSNVSDVSSSQPRVFLFISSAFVYGDGVSQGSLSCSQTTPESPRGSYGVGKLAAERLVRQFDRSDFRVYIARPFNHIGVGQEASFVVPALAQRIRDAKPGATIETGNMNALRDFTDVRDVVRAYRLIIERKPPERVFVIGRGQAVTIQSVFELLNRLSGKSLLQEVASHLKRAEGTAALIADSSLAQEALGWTPEITLEQSIKDIWYEP